MNKNVTVMIVLYKNKMRQRYGGKEKQRNRQRVD